MGTPEGLRAGRPPLRIPLAGCTPPNKELIMDQIIPDQTFWTIILLIAAALVLVLYIRRRQRRKQL